MKIIDNDVVTFVLKNLIQQQLSQEEVDLYLEEAITGTAHAMYNQYRISHEPTQEEVARIKELYLTNRTQGV